MKIFEYKYREDFGDNYDFAILKFKKYSFLQFSVFWGDPAGYYLQITSGNSRFFGLLLCLWKFGFDFELIARNWTIHE